MAQVLPNVKLIALLRDPVSRANSHYEHNRRPKHQRSNREPLSFENAIEQEGARLDGELARMTKDESYDSFAYRHYSYLQRGVYVDQLKRYLDFFDRSQVLIVKSEDLFRKTQQCYDEVLTFLGLQPHALHASRVRNSGKYVTRPEETLSRLREYFEPHNQRLYRYLQRDFGW